MSAIESHFSYRTMGKDSAVARAGTTGIDVVRKIQTEYAVKDINFIKPGIGEATRVLLRRIPWKIIVNSDFENAAELQHIYQLSNEKNVAVEISRVPLHNYKVCGIIKAMSDI